jgi:hypothetical protein
MAEGHGLSTSTKLEPITLEQGDEARTHLLFWNF